MIPEAVGNSEYHNNNKKDSKQHGSARGGNPRAASPRSIRFFLFRVEPGLPQGNM